jgi:steroid 5-alpha reductase family enzyme
MFFDLTRSLTYITLVGLAVVAAGGWEPRSLVLAGFVLAWAVRLGSFLFARVLQSGGDSASKR